MATPTDPTAPTTPVTAPTQQDIDMWNQYNVQTSQADANLSNVSLTGNTVNKAFETIDSILTRVGTRLENISTLTGSQATKFGLLTTATLGAQKSFESIAGIDTSRLNTFTDQLDHLLNVIKQAPGTKMASDLLDQWATRMKGAGYNASIVDRAVRELGSGIKTTAQAILTSADNNLRLQNSFFQLAGQMGDMNTLFSELGGNTAGFGDNLENINAITAKYLDAAANTSQATNVNRETVFQYAAMLSKIPGGLKEIIQGTEIGGQQTNLLTATIKLATGAGLDFADTTRTMNEAIQELGVRSTDALKFMAIMGDASNALNVQFSDIKSALMESVNGFKFFATGEENAARLTDSLTDAMHRYVGSLKSVGVSGQSALEMFRNYGNQLKNLTQAQEAFISAQTGGPGGLRGGFQIENLLRTGDIGGLQRRVEQTIRRMTGPIVSFEEAQRSESAAARYTRQLQILQQGPLGTMARTRAEAEDLLASMKKGVVTPTGKKPDEVLKDSIDRGTKIEQLSLTELHNVNVNLMRMQQTAGIANLGTIQRVMGARTGAPTDTGTNVAGQERLRMVQERGMHPPEGSPSERALKESSDTVKSMSKTFRDVAGSVRENLTGPTSQFTNIEDYAPAGKQLGRTIPRTTAATTGTATTHPGTIGTALPTTTGAAAGQPVPVVLASGSAINVNFTGVCPHCGRDVHTTEVARTVAPQALTTGR